jgi:transposase
VGVARQPQHAGKPDALERLSERGVPAGWIQSVRTLLEVVDDLDRQITQIELELRPIARTDPRARLLATIPGLGDLLALTITAEIGDISRFPNARKLIGYAGLAPTIKQSGQSSWTGPISKAGSPMLRWAAVEAAQHAWRPTNPWHRLYTQTKTRHGKANPAKSAVARKVLIASWHVLARQQEFKPAAQISDPTCPGKLPRYLTA